jgi:hypothetical protein
VDPKNESGQSIAMRLNPGLRIDAALILVVLCLICVASLKDSAGAQSGSETVPVKPLQARSRDGAVAGANYAGAQTCADCHHSIAASQGNTAMGRAALDIAHGNILSTYSPLIFRNGPYMFRIQRGEDGVVYSVSDGHATVSAPLLWAFGLGNAGQTYIFKHDGALYESRVSYYNEIGALDLTIGHSPQPPSSLSMALGRLLSPDELTKCFSCHTSEDIFAGKLVMSQVHPGVTCENCHGPGDNHVRLMESSPAADRTELAIFNPGRLAPADVNEFCGRCHRSTSDVLAANIRDIRNLRFQPYRLENSRCYDPTDSRITCLACHDPHKNLVTSSENYDAKCLACHAARGKSRVASQNAPACPTATENCVSCHMPKLALPGAHYAFTDHYIRISRPGEKYPE